MKPVILYVYHPLDENEYDVEGYLQSCLPDYEVKSFEIEANPSDAMLALQKTCCELHPIVIIASGVAGMFAHQMSHYKRLIFNPADQASFFDDEHSYAYDDISRQQFRHIDAEKDQETHSDYCNCWLYIANRPGWKFWYHDYVQHYYPNVHLYPSDDDNLTKEICDNIVIPFIQFHGEMCETDEDGVIYTEYGRVLVGIDKDKFTSEKYRVEDGCVRIADEAFADCTSLKSIHIASSVKEVGNGCFSGCCNLEDIVWSPQMTEIPACVCQGCSSLKDTHLPDFCERIADNAFDGTSLKVIEVPESMIYMADDAFPKGTRFIITRPMANKTFHELSYTEIQEDEEN